ncbi:hypothetical protein FOZ63_006832, partial [Perkinsus olseni]
PDRWSVEESVRLQDDGVLALLLDAFSESPNDILDAALVAACHAPSNARLVTCLLREHGARVTPAALEAAADSTIAASLLDNSSSLDLSVSRWVAVLGAHVAEPAVLETLWSSVRIPDRAKTQALEVAVAHDAPSAIVKAVESARKSILTRDDIESTLLVQSAQCGATRCLYYLLRDYATISISLPKIRLKVIPDTYVDALERAALNAHHTAIDMLLNNGCVVTETALVAATLGGSETCLQRLLFSADIKELKDRSEWWHQSLLFAAYAGRVGCARVLLSLWPDKAAVRIPLTDGGLGAAPLSVAAWRGHVGVVELLGEYCNWKQKANAVEIAAYMGYPRVCEKILETLPQPLPGWALPRKAKHEGIVLWLQDCTKLEMIS